MKKILYIIIASATSLFSFSSCSDWFDISPKTDVKAEELFETEYGFMSALAGIYVSMTDGAAYGGNLSFGMLDNLAQLYDRVPDGATNKLSIYEYERSTGGYNTKDKLSQSWLKAYNLIANANNLLKWLDQKGGMVIANGETRNMLRGEALAIRAYIHFDLLRGWGPVGYAQNPDVRSMKCIPYRVLADNSKQPLLAASEVVNKIIADLEDAKEYLSFESSMSLGTPASQDRRFRFNYHAVNALLARVYAYAGDATNAVTCAQAVIDHCGLSLKNDNLDDPALFAETICGLHMHEMDVNLSSLFSVGDKINQQNYCSFTTLNAIFQITGTESEDMRAKSSAFYRSSDEQKAISRKYIDNDREVIPLMRLPEMYYILCEMSALDDAAPYINQVRNKRGLSAATNEKCATEEERMAALEREYRKEFYAEGQYFFFLKSHGYTGALVHSADVSMDRSKYVFPLPDAEVEYGWTEESEAEGSEAE